MYSVKGWAKFQHFKDRRPPWIKLYRDILDDVEWHELDPASAKALVMLWLIASENEGNLPSIKVLAFRLRLSEAKVTAILSGLRHWIVEDVGHDDIRPISSRYHGDTPETETETETETEGEKEKTHAREDSSSVPGLDLVAWQTWVEYRQKIKKPLKLASFPAAQRALAKYGTQQAQVVERSIAQGWTGLFDLPNQTPVSSKKTPQPDNFAAVDYGKGGLL